MMQWTPPMSPVEQNRAAYERFCREVLVLGNIDAIDDLVDPSVVSHTPFPGQAPGREGFKEAFAQFRAAFPNLFAQRFQTSRSSFGTSSRATIRSSPTSP